MYGYIVETTRSIKPEFEKKSVNIFAEISGLQLSNSTVNTFLKLIK